MVCTIVPTSTKALRGLHDGGGIRLLQFDNAGFVTIPTDSDLKCKTIVTAFGETFSTACACENYFERSHSSTTPRYDLVPILKNELPTHLVATSAVAHTIKTDDRVDRDPLC